MMEEESGKVFMGFGDWRLQGVVMTGGAGGMARWSSYDWEVGGGAVGVNNSQHLDVGCVWIWAFDGFELPQW